MRIISGVYGGRSLVARIPDGVRPTLDAARESIFNILRNEIDLEGAIVADLFAGSGALSFEALSRGAAHVTLVEKHKPVLRCIADNARALAVPAEQMSVIHEDAMSFVQSCTHSFDLIFIDPPYALMSLNAIIMVIAERGLLKDDGVIVAEHGFAEHILVPATLELLRSRQFGETIVDFLGRGVSDTSQE